jgi:hypothetical protein
LWRVKLIGKLSEYYKFEIIFRSILQFITTTVDIQKPQYIHIPLSTTIYHRNRYLIPITKDISLNTLKIHDDYTYYFLIHFFSIFNPKSTLDLVTKIPTEKYPDINFIFSIKDKAIIYNLADLKSLIIDTAMYRNLERHINTLKLIEVGIKDVDINKLSDDDFESYVNTTSKEQEKSKVAYLDELDKDTSQSKDQKDKEEDTSTSNAPTEVLEYHKQIEKMTTEFIDQLEDITPAQKARCKKLAEKHKDITIGDKKIGDIVNTPNPDINGVTLDFLKDDIADPSMTKSSIINLDNMYMETMFEKDLALTLTSFSSVGLFLVDYKETEQIDELSKIKYSTATYEDINGKRHTIKFKFPIVDKNGVMVVNGTKSRMKKQQINIPICKISPTRVSLVSNFNKSLVERNVAKAHDYYNFIHNYIINKANKDKKLIHIEYNKSNYGSTKLPYEYTALGKHYGFITFNNYMLSFDYEKRYAINNYISKHIEEIKNIEDQYGILFGTTDVNNKLIFIDTTNVVRIVDILAKEIVEETTIVDLLFAVTGNPVPMVTEWVNLKILDKNIPIIFVLAYRYGLTNILKYIGMDYQLIDKGTRINKSTSDILIRFNDKTLVFNRYPLNKSLIVSGLLHFQTKDLDYEYFDIKDAYYELLVSKGMSTNYIKGIDDYFDLFIDPITYDVLKSMGEPTNTKDLLIRATNMLTTEEHIDPASMKNHRLRSYERFNSTLYNEMARQYAAVRSKKVKDSKVSINPEATFQRIIQDQAVTLVSEINPIQDIKDTTSFTYTGMGGRTTESFVVEDRKYPDDGVGIISESTPDGGNVSIVAYTTMDPSLKDIRGMYSVDKDKHTPTELLSVSGCLMPGVTNDDPKRSMFCNGQLSHHIPCENSEVSRVCTGYEKIIGYHTSDKFAHDAKEDGTIIEVKDGIAKVKYKSGKVEVIEFGKIQAIVDSSYINQNIVLNCKLGDKVKRGDILAYNTGFFSPNQDNPKYVDWKHGVYTNIALMETDDTIEDSSTISKRLGKQLTSTPSYLRTISITNETVLHEIVNLNDYVEVTDYLCTFEDQDIADLSIMNSGDEESKQMIGDFNKKTPRAKHAGYIVHMDVLYSCDISTMTPSLAKFVNKIVAKKNKKSNFAKDAENGIDYPKSNKVAVGTKFKNIEFGADTVVIMIYISKDMPCGVGDKIVFDSSLKSVIGKVMPEPIMSDGGIEVDALFGSMSISNRIVLSPLRQGLIERIFEKVETDIVDIYFK